MKRWQAATLVEHPGHADQSVHGHRPGGFSSVRAAHMRVTDKGKRATFQRYDSATGKDRIKSYKNLTPSSVKRYMNVVAKSPRYILDRGATGKSKYLQGLGGWKSRRSDASLSYSVPLSYKGNRRLGYFGK